MTNQFGEFRGEVENSGDLDLSFPSLATVENPSSFCSDGRWADCPERNVSPVISLAEGCRLRGVCFYCCEWTFPYVVMGAAVAGLASAASRSTNPDVTLLVVPAMYFVYVYYRMHIVRAVLESISSVSQENEAVLAGASHGR